jgi:hypothetical protein
MDRSTVERQTLMSAVGALPDEALFELSSFVDYLRYKSAPRYAPTNEGASFLGAVAGLGHSGQTDISERDEEILRREVDPVYGWDRKPNDRS